METAAPVRVAAVFEPGRRVRPVWFDLGGRKYAVERTTYSWSARKGRSLLLHFAVDAGGALFQLTYDSGAQAWEAARIEQ